MDKRKIILSGLGLLLIVGAVFAAKWIIDSNVKKDPEIQKVVKNVFVKTVKNDTVPISIQRYREFLEVVVIIFYLGRNIKEVRFY